MASDKTFRAITEVHITEKLGKAGDRAKGIAPVPPVVVVIPAKSKFTIDADSDVCKELLRGGAIVAVSDEEAKPAAPRKVTLEGKAAAKTEGKAAAKTEGKAPAKTEAKAPAKTDEDDAGSMV